VSSTPASTDVAVLCGGVGAARLLTGVVRAVDGARVTAIVNTGDDVTLHGLHVSPDLDTVTYTLAGAVNAETGWGLQGETWQAMAMVRRYGGIDWFNLGDRDLGTHLYRTHRLEQGASLAEVTTEIAAAWELPLTLLPVTDDPLQTRVTVADEGEIGFQEYFVRRHHDVAVSAVRFVGAETARPAPGVIEAIEQADVVLIAPSNPIVSIGPLLAVPGVRDALGRRRSDTIAISGIVAGKALKGPADRLLVELGHEASVAGVARLYTDLASTLVIDDADRDSRAEVEAAGMHCLVTDTIMRDPEVAARLTTYILDDHRARTQEQHR
jgi:LPPG:FO 2-phospho-L-lactate transferase